jgi:hypothetical protein
MLQPKERSQVKPGVIRPLQVPIGGLALAVEPDEAFNPIDVGALGRDAVVFKALVSDAG